jgi:putative acetyltransferase
MTLTRLLSGSSDAVTCESIIRKERPGDQVLVAAIHRGALGEDEAALVDALRLTRDAVMSLVAERNHTVVGHILFSRLRAPMRALSLAPLSVMPKYQRQGIGTDLVRAGLEHAEKDGWEAVFVLGDPSYYGRFGFDLEAARAFCSPYSGEGFMVRQLGTPPLPTSGEVIYPQPFRMFG